MLLRQNILKYVKNNSQLLAQMYTVTVDKEKIAHSNYRDILTHCSITL